MNSNVNAPNGAVARIPATFAMPTRGHAFDLSSRNDAFVTSTIAAVRDRRAGLVTAELGLVQAYSPGTRVWRPPIS